MIVMVFILEFLQKLSTLYGIFLIISYCYFAFWKIVIEEIDGEYGGIPEKSKFTKLIIID